MDIAQILLQAGLASQEQLLQALELQKETGSPLPYVICKLRFAPEDRTAAAVAAACGLTVASLEGFKADPDLLAKFPAEFLERNRVLPLSRSNGAFRLGVIEPCEESVLDEMRLITGEKVELAVIPPLTAFAVLADALASKQDTPDGKVKRPHRHADARTALSDLVQELEGEAKTPQGTVCANPDEQLYAFETRELLFGLIKALCDQGLVQKEDLIRAAQEL